MVESLVCYYEPHNYVVWTLELLIASSLTNSVILDKQVYGRIQTNYGPNNYCMGWGINGCHYESRHLPVADAVQYRIASGRT